MTFWPPRTPASLPDMEKPRTILMLAFPGVQMLDVTGPLQMFAAANDELDCHAYRILIAAPLPGRLRRRPACAWSRIFRLRI
jgi:transcriptional regulator GlxA family with amidase domain